MYIHLPLVVGAAGHIPVANETQRTRLIEVRELHETALSKTELEEELAELAEKDDDADDNTGQAGEDDQGGSGGLIEISKKNCQRLVQAALTLTQSSCGIEFSRWYAS
jgi:hypothetical protein